MTIFCVRHITSYRYKRRVAFGEHRLLFRPRDSFDQTLLRSHLKVDPEPEHVRWIHDVFGNCVALIGFTQASRDLRFETTIRLEHTPQAAMDLQIDAEALTYPFEYDPEEAPDLEGTIRRHYPDPDGAVDKWARQFVRVGQPTETGHLLMTMCYAIHESFIYARRTEHGTQAPLETLKLRRGTCRDFALLMMEAARALGLAARFVTGYIYVADRDGSTTLGGGSTHAWCQVYLPGAGWVEFDPTNGIVGNRDLIRVGVARDPKQAVPLWGSLPNPEDVSPLTTNDVADQLSTMPGSVHDLLDGQTLTDEPADNGVCLFAPQISLVLRRSAAVSSFGFTVAVPIAIRTCRIDLRTASRKAWLAFSIRCQAVRSFLLLRLGLHLGLRQKNLRQLRVCSRHHFPTSERRFEDMKCGELRWSDRE